MISVYPGVKGLIFDCDGTLADTMALHYQAWHETFAALSVSCSQQFIESHNGIPTAGIVARFNAAFGHQLDVELFTREKERRAQAKLSQVKPIIPVAAIAFAYQGKLPMAVASGGTRANVEITLKAIGLNGFFDAIITADDAVRPKPAPDIFLEAARRLGVTPRYCQVLEDADCGLEAARKAGMIATDIKPLLRA